MEKKTKHTPLPDDYNFIRINRSTKLRFRNITISEGAVGVCNEGMLLDNSVNKGKYSYSIILNEKTRDAIANQSPKYINACNLHEKLLEALKLAIDDARYKTKDVPKWWDKANIAVAEAEGK